MKGWRRGREMEIEMELETDDDEDIDDGVRQRRLLWRSLRRGSTTDLGS